ncbi:MAG TPA: pyrimidine dimer DNA glycosylase/endonuclease V [Rhodothermales bacterium]
MRLWSIHPKYLDARGLVALWREALLARSVLAGLTHGYRNHPQLHRFRACLRPEAAIGAYLTAVAEEAASRGYRFDTGRLTGIACDERIPVTTGQIRFEWEHLMAKLRVRAPELAQTLASIADLELHPLFRREEGPVEAWERGRIRK